jgi:pectinacetylesterase
MSPRAALWLLLLSGCQRMAPGWEWIEVQGTSCQDGSTTGIGVNRAAGSKDLLLFFEGGGQCWDYESCFVAKEVDLGPIRAKELGWKSKRFTGILSRAETLSPFRDWNLVYVPYCTGDFHGGSNVASYAAPDGSEHRFAHVGHDNVVADVARLRAMFPSVDRLVVVGLSAGGYGAAFNYPTVREALPARAAMLVDDSGPLLPGDAIAPEFRAPMMARWRLDKLVGAADDLSAVWLRLAERYPQDRMALLSSARDHDISATFKLPPERFEQALRALVAAAGGAKNVRAYVAPGDKHCLLDGMTAEVAAWVGAFVSGP